MTASNAGRARLIVGVAIFQVMILCGMLVRAAYPLWVGTEVILGVRPVDPRDLMRGQYVQLRYEITNVSVPSSDTRHGIPAGSRFYVQLDCRDTELGRECRAGGVSEAEPKTGEYIMGRTQYRTYPGGPSVDLRYGIEALFATPERAKNLEDRYRRRSLSKVRVRVAPGGRAALVGFVE